MADDKVLIAVSCGMAMGPPRWQNTEDYESDECPWDGYIWVDREDYDECGAPHIFCPTCTQELSEDCHYELVATDEVEEQPKSLAVDHEEYSDVYAKADLGAGLQWYREDWDYDKGAVLVDRNEKQHPRGSVMERRVAGDYPTD